MVVLPRSGYMCSRCSLRYLGHGVRLMHRGKCTDLRRRCGLLILYPFSTSSPIPPYYPSGSIQYSHFSLAFLIEAQIIIIGPVDEKSSLGVEIRFVVVCVCCIKILLSRKINIV